MIAKNIKLKNPDGLKVGEATYVIWDDCIEWRKIFINEHLRGKGYGTELIKYLVKVAKHYGKKYIRAHLHSDGNDYVGQFALANGFRLLTPEEIRKTKYWSFNWEKKL